jgi:uncharacterized membrane protein YfhO
VWRTHNTFSLSVENATSARYVLDSAYDPGWQTDVGTVVETPNKMLAVEVPPGEHAIHMKYWPRRLTLGFVLSFLGLAGVVWFFFFKKPRGRAASPS